MASENSRPFYIIGHNPNTIDGEGGVKDVLARGANAIEPDVNVYEDNPCELCISHGGWLGNGAGESTAPSVASFFDDLHRIARDNPSFSLVYLDCKERVTEQEHADALLAAIRDRLIGAGEDAVALRVLISVASVDQARKLFPFFASRLRPNEGLMIDEDRDPSAVDACYASLGVQPADKGYGFGNSVALGDVEITRRTIDKACASKAFSHVVAWTFNVESHQRAFVDGGASGIIVDGPEGPCDGIASLIEVVKANPSLRLATQDDTPFGSWDPAAT
jgi:hypothetical protein